MREIKLKWDAHAAFDRISVEKTEANAFGDGEMLPDFGDCSESYTPPSNVADWLALNKSRPIDPPRERDIEALRKAAFEPGSTPEKPIPKRGRTDDDCLREKFGGLPKALVDGLKRAAPAPAPVADSAVGEFEPVGTMPVVGDYVASPESTHENRRTPIRVDRVAFNKAFCGDQTFALGGFNDIPGNTPYVVLKRKNVAARAWKYPEKGHLLLAMRGKYYFQEAGSPWIDATKWGENNVRHAIALGYVELTDPAEIQRLVDELHAAGLGK